MKTILILRCCAVVFSASTVTVAADQTAGSPIKEKEFRGTLEYVNIEEHTVTVTGMLRQRTFDLGSKLRHHMLG
jgi:hypothetical protein